MVVAASTLPAVSATEPVTTSRRESLVILVSLALSFPAAPCEPVVTFSRIIGLPIDHGKDYPLREFPPHFAAEFATRFLASSAAHNQRLTTEGGAGRLLPRSDRKSVLLRSSRLFALSPAV